MAKLELNTEYNGKELIEILTPVFVEYAKKGKIQKSNGEVFTGNNRYGLIMQNGIDYEMKGDKLEEKVVNANFLFNNEAQQAILTITLDPKEIYSKVEMKMFYHDVERTPGNYDEFSSAYDQNIQDIANVILIALQNRKSQCENRHKGELDKAETIY